MKYQYAAYAVLAALFGQTQAIEVKESNKAAGYENQQVQVLLQNGNHIEMGIKLAAGETEAQKTQVLTENQATVQSNLKIASASQLEPDVYGPNGDNYGNNNPSYDYSRIKIDIADPGYGEKCHEGEWTSAHWVANLMHDGRVYSDTRQEGNREPKLFTLGGHHVIKCLDIAITQLKKGAKAHIECPSFYAFGGAWTQSFLKGGLPLPLHADVEYELEVLDCNIQPVEPVIPPPPLKLGFQAKRHMSLHIAKELGGEDLVLCCQDDDLMNSPTFKQWPGIQCYLEDYVKHDPNQLWVWDDQTFYLKNVATGFYLSTKNRRLIMGDFDHLDWNVCDHSFPWYPQWFEFCPYENVLETELDGEAVYASVQPNIKLRNDIEIESFHETDTQDILDKGIFRVQYEFKNW